MVKRSNKALDVCNSRYSDICSECENNPDKRIIVSHFGEFTQDLVNSISGSVEESLKEAGDKKGIVKRIFSILIEGLQNIRLHGEKDPDGQQTSFIVITQDEKEYGIITGNLVRKPNLEIITENLENINQKDRDQLKEYYMEVLTNGMISSRGGAGLGFITMAMKSKNKLDYQIDEIDDELSCLTITTRIKRKKQKEIQ